MFESVAIKYASDSLVLLCTPTDTLAGKSKDEQQILQIRRDRLLDTLERESTSLDPQSQLKLCDKICALRKFFGTQQEGTAPNRDFGMIANTIDHMICKKTIESLKDGGKALTPKEKLKNKQTRDKILKITEEKIGKISESGLQRFHALVDVLYH